MSIFDEVELRWLKETPDGQPRLQYLQGIFSQWRDVPLVLAYEQDAEVAGEEQVRRPSSAEPPPEGPK